MPRSRRLTKKDLEQGHSERLSTIELAAIGLAELGGSLTPEMEREIADLNDGMKHTIELISQAALRSGKTFETIVDEINGILTQTKNRSTPTESTHSSWEQKNEQGEALLNQGKIREAQDLFRDCVNSCLDDDPYRYLYSFNLAKACLQDGLWSEEERSRFREEAEKIYRDILSSKAPHETKTHAQLELTNVIITRALDTAHRAFVHKRTSDACYLMIQCFSILARYVLDHQIADEDISRQLNRAILGVANVDDKTHQERATRQLFKDVEEYLTDSRDRSSIRSSTMMERRPGQDQPDTESEPLTLMGKIDLLTQKIDVLTHRIEEMRGVQSAIDRQTDQVAKLAQLLPDISALLESRRPPSVRGIQPEEISAIPSGPDWLSARDAARSRHSSLSTIRNAAAEGQIPGAIKAGGVWYIPRDGLNQFTPRPPGRPSEKASPS